MKRSMKRLLAALTAILIPAWCFAGVIHTVTDPQATSASIVHVIDGQSLAIDLTWTAPTENEDGTPIDDLAGYRLYEDVPGVLYLTAVDQAGQESAPSNAVRISVTQDARPGEPVLRIVVECPVGFECQVEVL